MSIFENLSMKNEKLKQVMRQSTARNEVQRLGSKEPKRKASIQNRNAVYKVWNLQISPTGYFAECLGRIN